MKTNLEMMEEVVKMLRDESDLLIKMERSNIEDDEQVLLELNDTKTKTSSMRDMP